MFIDSFEPIIETLIILTARRRTEVVVIGGHAKNVFSGLNLCTTGGSTGGTGCDRYARSSSSDGEITIDIETGATATHCCILLGKSKG